MESKVETVPVTGGEDSTGLARIRLFWDFFGANAEGTARHFESHLLEFLEREKIAGCLTGLASTTPGHWATWCGMPEEHEDSLSRALKPRRREPESSGS